VTGVHGVFYKVLLDGTPLKRRRGSWTIPLRNGKSTQITARGLLPGFQRLYLNGEQILDLGAHVSLLHKVLVFVPLLLLLINPYIGGLMGLIVVFLNIMTVKNPQIPPVMRTVTAILNTVAAGFILFMLGSAS
jgi:hypothetical protein